MKFKVGDKVRCLQPALQLKINEIYTIKKIENHWDEELFFLKEINNSWNSCRFEFVESNTLEKQSNETEEQYLQRLVDKANEGLEAVGQLNKKYSHRIRNLGDLNRNWNPLEIKPNSHKFKVAQWEAEISGDKVKIGCETFIISELKKHIKNLIQDINRSDEFYAMKSGIRFKVNFITWDQAEELLKELEK